MKKVKKLKKYCFKCHKIFHVHPCNKHRKYCSQECYHPILGKKEIVCLKCKKIFYVSKTPWALSHLPKYCSSKCCNKHKHIVTHHLDLNPDNNRRDNKIKLTNSKHLMFHRRAYQYLVLKNMITEYLEWFRKEIGL